MKRLTEKLAALVERVFSPLPPIRPYTLNGMSADRPYFLVGFVNVETSRNGSDHASIEQKILQTLEATDNYDLIIAPEYSFVPPNNVFTEHEKNTLVQRLADATDRKKALLIPGTILWEQDGKLRNTAYALSDGNVFCEYHKQRNGGEEEIAKTYNLTYARGTTPGTFHWRNFSIGMEICADTGTLLETRAFYDLHILISCGRSHTDPCGRYLLINDGCAARISIIKGNHLLFSRQSPET